MDKIFQLKLYGILLWIALVCDGAFISEPSNVTVVEGENVTFNCSMDMISEDIATWVIDGLEYYWSDFGSTKRYSFNLRDNSLTIHYSSPSLDGSSFQCILDNRRSRMGYLRVLHGIVSPTSLPMSNSSNSTTFDEATSVHLTLPSFSTLPLITSIPEATSSAFYTSVIIVAPIVGTIIIAFSLLSVCCILVICLLRQSSASKPDVPSGSQDLSEGSFDMNESEPYVLTQPIKMTRNPVYVYTHKLSKPP